MVQEKHRKNTKKALGLVGLALLAGLLGFGCKNSVSSGTPAPTGEITLNVESNAQNIPKGESLQFTAEFTGDEPGTFTWTVVSGFEGIEKHDDTIIEDGLLLVSSLETSPRLKVEVTLNENPNIRESKAVYVTDMTSLIDYINIAATELRTTLHSGLEEYDNTPVGYYYIDPNYLDVWDDLNKSLESARPVAENKYSAQSDIDLKATSLTGYLATFRSRKVEGGQSLTAAKSMLGGLITTGNGLIAKAVRADNADYALPGVRWVSPAIYDALETAVRAAEIAYDTPDQDVMNRAASELRLASKNFTDENAKKENVGSPTTEAKAALSTVIASAAGLISEADPASDADHVPPDDYWVSGSVYDALEDAIDNAGYEAGDGTSNTKAAVEAASAALGEAMANFTADKKPGAGTETVKAALASLITDAEALKSTADRADSEAEVAAGHEWVPIYYYDALDAAITHAGDVKDTGNTKAELDAALAALDKAMDDFEKTKGGGTGIAIAQAELDSLIAEAKALKGTVESITEEQSADDVAPNKKWAYESDHTVFLAVITAAEAAAQNTDETLSYYIGAITTLQAGTDAFNTAVGSNEGSSTTDEKATLRDLVRSADALKNSVKDLADNTNNNDVAEGVTWAG
ncbi:MAG: hypothetical protein LBF78_03085, partial [Treponema sp.]|nr:hypothetical protein [Treponema sp.]